MPEPVLVAPPPLVAPPVLMAPPVLVAVAHGSADPRASATIGELMAGTAERAAVRGLRALEARTAFLGHAPPSLPQVMGTIEPGRQVRVLPLLLTSAYHSKADIPRMLARVSIDFPRLRVCLRRHARPAPAAALRARAAPGRGRPAAGGADRARTGVVLAAAGSSDPAGQRHHHAPGGAVAGPRRVVRRPPGLRLGRRPLACGGGDQPAARRSAPGRSGHLPARPRLFRRPDQDVVAGRGRGRRLRRARRLR